jgi:outer membrane protein
MKRTVIIPLLFVVLPACGQEVWTMERCMQYAVEHNHEVRLQALALDDRHALRLQAVGAFLPQVEASTSGQYNFGRAIDPETNTYTDVSTFYNGYGLSASLPVFDGFSRVNALRAAKASVLMGRNALREQQDQTAIATLQAWVNALYYEGTVAMAEEKQRETDLLLRQTQVLVEVGRKSAADLAQIAAQRAEAAYELTRQENLRASAMLDLKRQMALPLDTIVSISVPMLGTAGANAWNQQCQSLEPTVPMPGTSGANGWHPALQQQYHTMQARLYEWRQARAALLPALSLSAGLNTTYFKTLHTKTTSSFSDQFKNNMGEYLGATLSIPLFNRLQTITSIRKAKNNYRIARETYEDKQRELEKLSREAWQDWLAYLKQTEQMIEKVEADSIAYQLTRRQFEEGLSTAIDLHTTSTQLLQSKATLLQCQLMAMVKHELVRYYNGEQIWTE